MPDLKRHITLAEIEIYSDFGGVGLTAAHEIQLYSCTNVRMAEGKEEGEELEIFVIGSVRYILLSGHERYETEECRRRYRNFGEIRGRLDFRGYNV